MSRSYKHNPYIKDNHKSSHKNKQIASRRLRRGIPVESEETEVLINSPSAFKKINNDTWDIHDYVDFTSEEEARAYYRRIASSKNDAQYIKNFLNDYPTEDDYIEQHWAKYFKRK